MRADSMKVICAAPIVLAIDASSVWAAKPDAVSQTSITEVAQKLETPFTLGK